MDNQRQPAPARDESLYQAVLNSLPEHLIVLDREGRVILTNAAPSDAAEIHHPPVGVDYLRLAGTVSSDAADGIRDVATARRRDFSSEYECPRTGRWFLLNVRELSGGRGAVVSHLDITAR